MWSRPSPNSPAYRPRRRAPQLAELLDVPAPEERDLAAARHGRPAEGPVELTIRRHDGEERRLRLAHSAIFTGGTWSATSRDHDLTREYRTERLKSDFIAMVSHELRTPLTPIIGYVDLLRTRGERMTPEKRGDPLALIGDRAAHLSRLVEDLLLASRVDGAGEGHRSPSSSATHDLSGIVRQMVVDLDDPRIVLDVPAETVPAAMRP